MMQFLKAISRYRGSNRRARPKPSYNAFHHAPRQRRRSTQTAVVSPYHGRTRTGQCWGWREFWPSSATLGCVEMRRCSGASVSSFGWLPLPCVCSWSSNPSVVAEMPDVSHLASIWPMGGPWFGRSPEINKKRLLRWHWWEDSTRHHRARLADQKRRRGANRNSREELKYLSKEGEVRSEYNESKTMTQAATALMLAALMCSGASGFLVQHPSSLGPRSLRRAAPMASGGFAVPSRMPPSKRGSGLAMSTAEVVDVVGSDDSSGGGPAADEFDVKTDLLKQIDLSSSRRMRSVGVVLLPRHCYSVASEHAAVK